MAARIIDRHVFFAFTKPTLLLFGVAKRDNELIQKVKMKLFFWLAHWSKPVFAKSTLDVNSMSSNYEKLIGQNLLNSSNYPLSLKMQK